MTKIFKITYKILHNTCTGENPHTASIKGVGFRKKCYRLQVTNKCSLPEAMGSIVVRMGVVGEVITSPAPGGDIFVVNGPRCDVWAKDVWVPGVVELFFVGDSEVVELVVCVGAFDPCVDRVMFLGALVADILPPVTPDDAVVFACGIVVIAEVGQLSSSSPWEQSW